MAWSRPALAAMVVVAFSMGGCLTVEEHALVPLFIHNGSGTTAEILLHSDSDYEQPLWRRTLAANETALAIDLAPGETSLVLGTAGEEDYQFRPRNHVDVTVAWGDVATITLTAGEPRWLVAVANTQPNG